MSKEAKKLALEAFKEIADETYDSWTNGAKAQRIAQAMIPKLEEALAKQEQDGNVCARCGGIVFDPVIKQEQGEVQNEKK